jgi:hypothetical protein
MFSNIHYECVQSAVESMDINTNVSKVLLKRKLKEIWKAVGSPNICTEKIRWNWKVETILFGLFNNVDRDNCLHKLFDKTVRIGQTTDGKIVIFSDVYDTYNGSIIKMIQCNSANGGPPIQLFQKTYTPPGDGLYKDAWEPPPRFKMLCTGYRDFYRGTISGFIIG